ncbi:hypothetical protein ITP53_43550 [Nonomuraea sp. K274]|uniref:Uncharacterized protein n=1 Tax=Nonomuraea cypriaca TaxID=1187855 RepID=A0A931ALK2_9ACTN|nr:hypothetical protein [Nonomuraea cypriaca]MBF8192445.1 hypothetical protein [Nonomuraea cypriaca]
MYGFQLGDHVATRAGVIDRVPHQRTRVGRVTGFGRSDTGDPFVIVTWPGPDGDAELYPPVRLVRVYRDWAGIPRPIEQRRCRSIA